MNTLYFLLLCICCYPVVNSQDPLLCPLGKWMCNNTLCISRYVRCNGLNNCGDDSDEQNCDKYECPSTMWTCANHRCIPLDWRCDGADSCGDNSDEKTCGNIKIVCPEYFMESNDLQHCRCLAKGVARGDVSWPGHSNTDVIAINDVQRKDDEKQLTCVDAIHQTKAVYTLRVAYGPQNDDLTIDPVFFVSNGPQKFTLTCNASNVHPTPYYEWGGITCENRVPENKCVFHLDPASEHTTNVTCRAISRVGRTSGTSFAPDSWASRQVQLTFSYPPPSKPVIQPLYTGRQYLQTGDKLTCTVTGGKPHVDSVYFYCLNPYLPDEDDECTTASVFSSVTVNSTEHNIERGTECLCNATWGVKPHYYQLTSTVFYNVEHKAEVESVKLNKTIEAVTVYGADNLTLQLTCTASGRPVPTAVIVKRGNTALTSPGIQYTRTGNWSVEAAVTLSDIQCRDMGTYSCTAHNGVGLPHTRSTMLNVRCPPKKSFRETLSLTDKGIHFNLEAHPVPKAFDFSLLGNTVSSERFSSKCQQDPVTEYTVACSIVPLDVPGDLLGLYTVSVSNGLGRVDVIFNIRREDKAVVESVTLNNMNETVTAEGDDRVTMYLVCSISGLPVPSTVQISHRHTIFTLPVVRSQRGVGWTYEATARLPDIQCNDMGTYSCTAGNGIMGNETKGILLNVKCLPRKLFGNNLNMKQGKLTFQLAAYPVPDTFFFNQIDSQTRPNVTDRFSAKCIQDPVTVYFVNCEATLLHHSQSLTGIFRAEVYNELGKADFVFSINRGEESKQVWGAVVGVFVIFTIVFAVVVFCRRRCRGHENAEAAEDTSSDEYEEIDELFHHLPAQRLGDPTLPQLPGVVLSAHPSSEDLVPDYHSPSTQPLVPDFEVPGCPLHEQHIDSEHPLAEYVQESTQPLLPDAGVPFTTEHDSHSDTDQPEEIEMSDLLATPLPRNAYEPLQQTDPLDDQYMYTQLDKSSGDDPTDDCGNSVNQDDDYIIAGNSINCSEDD